jgi:hypothetical protein
VEPPAPVAAAEASKPVMEVTEEEVVASIINNEMKALEPVEVVPDTTVNLISRQAYIHANESICQC